jgi:hypothetical protein
MRNTAASLKAAVVSRLSKARRVGVAIGAQKVYVTSLANGGSRRNSFSPWSASFAHSLVDGTTDLEETISAALRDCPHLGRENPAVVNVVFLPPLALGRHVRLPRLSEAEYRQVLARDAFRYFPTDRSPRVVGALKLSTRQSSPVPIFATAASARLVDAVQKAFTAVGCEIESLDCAYASWVGAATSMWPSLGRSKSAIIVCHDDVTEIIHIDGARPEIVRRVAANASFDQVLHAIGLYANGGPPRACAILGSAERYEEWGANLSEAGIAVLPSTPTSTCDGGTLSAMYAGVGAGPGLYPERIYAESRAASQRLARRLGVIAAALVIIAGGLTLWGAKRELRATVTERAAIRSDVARALALRSDIGGLDARAAMIATLSSTTPRWSSVISSVARALPADAHLTSIQAHADTIVLEGVATRAGGVFEALQRDPDITAVHSNAPVRQQLQDGTPVEHFGVAARLAPPSAPEQ